METNTLTSLLKKVQQGPRRPTDPRAIQQDLLNKGQLCNLTATPVRRLKARSDSSLEDFAAPQHRQVLQTELRNYEIAHLLSVTST